MEAIVIYILFGIVFVLVWAIVGLMDEVRSRDEALQWLYDNGHTPNFAAEQVARIVMGDEAETPCTL